jgi:site-specific DNA-methyltransferase (adenine-specific)
MSVVIWHGDCRKVIATMEPDSIDACVTDPPYALGTISKRYGPGQQPTQHPVYARITRGFMNATWDTDVAFQPETWRAVWRVLKPGAHLVAFGSPRTYHRLACAIEDAGFEVRDCITWMFGSGMPKSLDVSKAIDKAAGAKRRVVATERAGTSALHAHTRFEAGYRPTDRDASKITRSVATTDAAQQWDGWGTGLKPAVELICLARKPLSEGSVARNVLKHGTGAINVDGSRVETSDERGGGRLGGPTAVGEGWDRPWMHDAAERENYAATTADKVAKAETLGRHPANVLFTHSPSCREVGTRKVRTGTHVGRNSTGTEKFSGNYGTGMLEAGTDRGYADPDGTETISMWECGPDCPVRILDEQAGERTSGGRRAGVRKGIGYGGGSDGDDSPTTVASTGGASRFFTVTNWTDADLDTARFRYTAKASSAERREGLADRTGHATVKPVSIMGWLVGLVTPPGGTVLDPFFGSGTTGIASQGLGRDISCIGIEQERRWVDDARDRIGMFAEVRETTDGAA